MSWLSGMWERVREATNRRRFEEDLDEEIRFHLERETERLMTQGLDPDRARAEARRIFGEVTRVKDDAREDSGIPWAETALRDARVALRGLRKSPGFAVAAILTLGIGIGATTAIFSVVDSVLLEPLPYPEPDRLVTLHEQNSPENVFNISVADFLAIEREQQVFDAVAAFQGGTAAFTGRGEPEQIAVVRVTAGWFDVLGVRPMEGRGFLPGEDRPGAEPAVVLSAPFRDRVFGTGVDALGSSMVLDDVPHTVVGVLDEHDSMLAGTLRDAWPIFRLDPPRRRGPFVMRGLGRIRADRTIEDARADMDGISQRLFPVYFNVDWRDEKARITPYPFRDLVVGDIGGGLWLMLGAVAGVLLIAVANVANLFLVRAAGREREMVMRASLGASRRRLAGQLLTESVVVAVLGGLTGVAFAWLGLRGLVASGAAIPRLGEIAMDGSILLWTAVITLGSALLFGLAPMARVATARLGVRGLGERGSTRSIGWNRLRSALVTAEFAIAFSLATGAGLLLISFVRLQRVDPGYDDADVLAVQLSLPATRYAGPEEIRVFWDEAARRTSELPGVLAVGVGDGLPPGGVGSVGTNNFDLLDRPVADGESEPVALWNMVSPDFFSALGVPLLKGRVFDERDRAGQEPVILVSDSWAKRFYPDREVLGAQLFAGGDRSVAMTVVGVVGDVKYQGLDVLDDAAIYEPDWQAALRAGYLVVRGRSGVDVVQPVRAALAALDPNLPTTRIQTMVERTRGTLAQPRQWTTLLGLFAGFGLLLACVGVYGVLSHFVSTQKKEIGIRISLGAEPSSVRRLVIGRGMSLATVGIVLGAGASLYLARWLRSLVFGVSPHDPLTLAMVALGLAMVALVSCTLPALSATRIDPAITLKGD